MADYESQVNKEGVTMRRLKLSSVVCRNGDAERLTTNWIELMTILA